MAKFVHRDRQKQTVFRSRKHVAVVYAAPAVLFRIGQDDDVLIVQIAQSIVQVFEFQRSEVSFAVKRIKMRRQSRLFPHTGVRNAHPVLGARERHGTHVETITIFAKRRIFHDFIARGFRLGKKLFLRLCRIALAHNHEIDARFHRIASMNPAPRRCRCRNGANQDVVDLHRMRHLAHRPPFTVIQRYRNSNISARKG